MDWCLLVVGEYKLYHSVWEPPIMYVAWKISRSHSCYVDSESIPLKMLFISLFQNRALAPQQIPASLCDGPIYLLLCWVITLLLKALAGERCCHLHPLLLVYIEYDYDWISFTMNAMSSQSLIFKGTLHLCFAVSKRASEIPSYYIILWLFWESVVIRDLLLLLASLLCHWYE